MPTFDYQFSVNAPQRVVLDFHHDTSVLKTLTPPPLFVQLHSVEPLGEGSKADFTIWFGPFPIRWQAVHSNVDEQGFTDTLVAGPLKSWQHRHQFVALNDEITQVNENIKYEFEKGVKGLLSRLMYSRPALTLLFTARKFITKKKLKNIMRSKNGHH